MLDTQIILLCYTLQLYIQGVSEIRVLILTSGRTRQFMKLFKNILQNSQKFSKMFCPPIFTKRVVSVIN
jgi:hypothetical protein